LYLIGYNWDASGKWSYSDKHSSGALSLSVPLPDDSIAPIQQYSGHTARIILGGSACPSGEPTGALGYMVKKASEWAQIAQNSGLRPRDFHVSVSKKFWPKLKYGICANTCPYDELVVAMHRLYFWMAPIGGLIRSAKRELRFLDTGFYGLGFPHWGIKTMIEAYKCFFVHYRTQSIIEVQLQMSVEVLTMELGTSSQPSLHDYAKYGPQVTRGFCDALWEKLHKFWMNL
jgi:hypothetical protein